MSTGEFWFDDKAADNACLFFPRYLTHVKGKWASGGEHGAPLPLNLDQWQKDEIIRPIFGWKRKDETRRYRTAYVEIPRKNAKTTLSAGIALELLFLENEPGAEIYSAAADREQASICFEIAKQMVLNNPQLRKRCKIYRKAIVHEKGRSYKVLSADAFTKHGLNASGIIFDELHAQPNRELWDVLTTSTGARTQPLVIAITTAGHDQQSICWEIHEHACKVRDGIVEDPSFLPVIYGAEKEDDWTAEATWKKANPGYGVSIFKDYFVDQVAKAKDSPSSQNTFKRLHLNIWTDTEVLWLQMDKWDACNAAPDLEKLKGKECYGGLDLAKTGDLTAFSLIFPDSEGGYDVLPYFWIPAERAKLKARRDRVPYLEWVSGGLVEATPGDVTDYAYVRKRIGELGQLYSIREIAYDPWNATQTAIDLQGDGFVMKQFRQGFASMNEPTKGLEALVLEGKVRHGGHPVLRWNASNVSVKTDPAGNIKPVKPDYLSAKRIDGIVATIMALGLHIGQPQNFFDVVLV